MPVYEYQCQQCGQVQEVLTPNTHSEVGPAACPQCGPEAKFSRMMSAFAAVSSSHGHVHAGGCCGTGGGGGGCDGGGCLCDPSMN